MSMASLVVPTRTMSTKTTSSSCVVPTRTMSTRTTSSSSTAARVPRRRGYERPAREGRGRPARAAAEEADAADIPWSISRYFTRNKKRETDTMGRIVNGEIVEPPGWEEGGEMQLSLAVSCTARDTGLTESAILSRLHELLILFPDIRERGTHKIATVVRMSAGPEEGVQARVLNLRALLPNVDIAAIVGKRPDLMIQRDWNRLEDSVLHSRSMLIEDIGASAADAFIEDQPDVLDARLLEGALREVGRLFPDDSVPPSDRIVKTPSLLYSAESLIGVEAYAPGTDLNDYKSRFD